MRTRRETCAAPSRATTAATSPPAFATGTSDGSSAHDALMPPCGGRRDDVSPSPLNAVQRMRSLMRLSTNFSPSRIAPRIAALLTTLVASVAWAQGFDKINTTVTNINTILVTISIAVVTIAIIWAGFKMIFQGARLADVANVLIGGTLIGGAAAFASYIVS